MMSRIVIILTRVTFISFKESFIGQRLYSLMVISSFVRRMYRIHELYSVSFTDYTVYSLVKVSRRF
jgi:hypothetical protein